MARSKQRAARLRSRAKAGRRKRLRVLNEIDRVLEVMAELELLWKVPDDLRSSVQRERIAELEAEAQAYEARAAARGATPEVGAARGIVTHDLALADAKDARAAVSRRR